MQNKTKQFQKWYTHLDIQWQPDRFSELCFRSPCNKCRNDSDSSTKHSENSAHNSQFHNSRWWKTHLSRQSGAKWMISELFWMRLSRGTDWDRYCRHNQLAADRLSASWRPSRATISIFICFSVFESKLFGINQCNQLCVEMI